MIKRAASKEVTKRIKQELAETFPGVKFSVRQSPGSALIVEWEDGPTQKAVEAATHKYEAGYFDGMTDSYDYKRIEDLCVVDGVEYSARYLHRVRRTSPATEGALLTWAHEYYDLGPNAQPWDYEAKAWQRFCETAYPVQS